MVKKGTDNSQVLTIVGILKHFFMQIITIK